ncbi:hypothetical protein ADUPG1_009967, partial [Aduncisulcus paluster]
MNESTGGRFPPKTNPHPTFSEGLPKDSFLTATINSIPSRAELCEKTGIPMSIHYSPFIKQPSLDQSVPIIDVGTADPIRCRRCGAYLNPNVYIHPGGHKYTCKLCGIETALPQYIMQYLDTARGQVNPARQDGVPMLTQNTVEYIVKDKKYLPTGPFEEYPPQQVKPLQEKQELMEMTAQPLSSYDILPFVHLLIIDTTPLAVSGGSVNAICLGIIDAIESETIPTNVRILPVLCDDRVRVFSFDRSSVAEEGGVIIAAEVIVCVDDEVPFAPLPLEYMSLSVHDKDSTIDFFRSLPGRVIQEREERDTVKQHFMKRVRSGSSDARPSPFSPTLLASSVYQPFCLSYAISFSLSVLCGIGGRVTCFISNRPNVGSGNAADIDSLSEYGGEKEMLLLCGGTDYFKSLSSLFVENNIAFDVIGAPVRNVSKQKSTSGSGYPAAGDITASSPSSTDFSHHASSPDTQSKHEQQATSSTTTTSSTDISIGTFKHYAPDSPTVFSSSSPSDRTLVKKSDPTHVVSHPQTELRLEYSEPKPLSLPSFFELVRKTGGEMHLTPVLTPCNDPLSVYDIERGSPLLPHPLLYLKSVISNILTKEQAIACSLRLRCSKGLSIQKYSGCISDKPFLPSIEQVHGCLCDNESSVEAHLAWDEARLAGGSAGDSGGFSFVQAACLYTHRDGSRRVRVSNMAFSIVELARLFKTVNCNAFVASAVKTAVAKVPYVTLRSIRDAFGRNILTPLVCYRKEVKVQPDRVSLHLPSSLSNMPLFIYSLGKDPALHPVRKYEEGGVIRVDERIFRVLTLLRGSVSRVIRTAFDR